MPAMPEIAASMLEVRGEPSTWVTPRATNIRVVHCQYLSGAGAGEGEVLLQQEQQQKDHHTQQEIVGMYHRKGGFAGEGVQLGELPVEYPARHGEDRIEQGTVHIAFH